MSNQSRVSVWAVGFVGVGLFLNTGCGSNPKGSGTPVSGKIVFPNDVKVEQGDQIQIGFLSADGGKQVASATVNPPDLSFVANGADAGVPPGKYKITIRIAPTPKKGSDTVKRTRGFDEGLNKRFDAENSKLNYEVTGGENNITIDLSKGIVTAN